ncbi:MAG: DinB family protein, partial [Paenisporosarcina sp.]
NVGHIFISMETMVQKALPEYELVHADWIPLFAPGTKPSDWTMAPPTNDELLSALAEQPSRIKAVLEGKLNQPLAEAMKIGNFHEMATVQALIQFAVWHEGIHAGVIWSMSKINVY